MGIAEIFVVRIYRRPSGAHGNFAGIVDLIGADTRHSFHSLDQLCAILRTADRARGRAALVVVTGKSKA